MSSLAEKIVAEAINEVNADQETDEQVVNTGDTALLSEGSSVDSLVLVRLLLAVERIIEEQTGKTVVVVDESAFEVEQSPFASVGSLTRHVEKLLG